jgi:hypothetical protein
LLDRLRQPVTYWRKNQFLSILSRRLYLKKSNYIFMGVAGVILGVAVLIAMAGGPRVVMSGIMSANGGPENLDTAPTRLSEKGDFQVSYTSSLDLVPVNQMHTWTIRVETAGGEPIEGAEIMVDGGMPQHRHGLPTTPQVTQDLGEGEYLVEGLRFHMPGWWEVKFQVTANGKSDSVTFNLDLK